MQQKATVQQIAKMAGVSVMTVTRAFRKGSRIKPERREKILELCRLHGYRLSTVAGRLACRPIRL